MRLSHCLLVSSVGIFFGDALAFFRKYRQNALVYATIALINGALLILSSIGHFLSSMVKLKKIKRVDCFLGNKSLHLDIFFIFKYIISMLTNWLSLCVISVD